MSVTPYAGLAVLTGEDAGKQFQGRRRVGEMGCGTASGLRWAAQIPRGSVGWAGAQGTLTDLLSPPGILDHRPAPQLCNGRGGISALQMAPTSPHICDTAGKGHASARWPSTRGNAQTWLRLGLVAEAPPLLSPSPGRLEHRQVISWGDHPPGSETGLIWA